MTRRRGRNEKEIYKKKHLRKNNRKEKYANETEKNKYKSLYYTLNVNIPLNILYCNENKISLKHR